MALNVGFMTMPVSASNEVVAHSKTFLNLTNDGMATKQFGGDDVLEVVFAEEVPKDGIKIGDTVKFKVLYKGSPLANADVNASYIGAEATYGGPGEGWVNLLFEDEPLHTDNDGFVTLTFDHASGWLVVVELVDEDSETEYVGGAMFNVASKDDDNSDDNDDSDDSSDSDSGCDAGFGVSLLAGLPALLPFFLRKKRA
jgi:Synergist-CTERM protein sorting domain-containing protein